MAKLLPIDNNVKELRERHNNMTQGQLGELVGVTRQTVAAIEQRRYSPSLETAFRIAREFGVGLDDVFTWQGQS
ncbi:helix-turn-helix transcriptional regulator [Psychrosphaera haliotis]|uniref:Helix-turn-helix domain-containing protein n=1 Tax=Psychrosphaera haliotis TaxID=555083 RepID=A0A6N8FES0_9GAMM|nr:helix-turn-helix transcriptional regulator [Psychrosphaera haliotis]MDB2374422.1 helix-turn-helix transcriptional regulator [Psychrosphaera haliotis]MUH73657.1 helix-turn-helix domain-containing protein [Psychrosphaera haliotis]